MVGRVPGRYFSSLQHPFDLSVGSDLLYRDSQVLRPVGRPLVGLDLLACSLSHGVTNLCAINGGLTHVCTDDCVIGGSDAFRIKAYDQK